MSLILDESDVPSYELPSLAIDVPMVAHEAHWPSVRVELLERFGAHVYGNPPADDNVEIEVAGEVVHDDPDGELIERTISITRDSARRDIHLLVALPSTPRPAPIFLALNFHGNHTVVHDNRVALAAGWVRDLSDQGAVVNSRATEAGRGCMAGRWPIGMIRERGFGLVTAYVGDLEPDHPEGRPDGVRGLFDDSGTWGAIAAWAWGLSRVLDHLRRDDVRVDGDRVVALGHSRLGKTALWAAAQDARFAAAVSNNSGCLGAAISRRRFGETIALINELFPHWFASPCCGYAGREDELPVDQHQLLALLAPRPLYVASASEDLWADPTGEGLALESAAPAWDLAGASGCSVLGRHVRSGAHGIDNDDWEHFLRWAATYVAESAASDTAAC